jgi:ribosome-binding protein aMBF1 (putative translation factor)
MSQSTGGEAMTDFNDFYEDLREQAAAEGPQALAELEALEERYRLARTVIERRKALGLSQKDLAAASGIDQADISRIEHGHANPTFGTLNALARALGWHVCLAEACEPVASHQAHTAVG